MSNKITYAQSSDIKSRTFQEYRYDMKKKAIAELEFLPTLENILRKEKNDQSLVVKKHGVDSKLWFAQDKRPSSKPDYITKNNDGEEFLYEFQYAQKNDLKFFDFKEAKVGKKYRGERTPHADRKFFYVIQSNKAYGFFSPCWIAKHGEKGVVPAWGNRMAYRVKSEIFLSVVNNRSKDVDKTILYVERKLKLLDFQKLFLIKEIQELSAFLQQSVDRKEIFKIVPTTVLGFFKICLLLNKMQEKPKNAGVWLVYACSFFAENLSSVDLARLTFCIDFLYFANYGNDIQSNEISSLEDFVLKSINRIKNNFQSDGSCLPEPQVAPVDAIQATLFALNLLEDISQCLHYINDSVKIKPIKKIFDFLPDASQTATYVQKNLPAGTTD